MKRLTFIILTLTLFLTTGINSMAQTTKRGDVNRDGFVDISDVVAVINTIAGDDTYKSTADVNNDNNTDISDVVAIINIIAGGSSPDENSIRLSDLTKIIFNGDVMQVFYGDKTTDYTIEKGLELSLNEPGYGAGNEFLDFYFNGEIVTSLTFKDIDKLIFGEKVRLDFWLNDKIIHQTFVSTVDSIVVYDRSKEPLSYLGVIGFNQSLYEKQLGVIFPNTLEVYKSFISSLTTQNGTILYFAADNALDRIDDFNFGTQLKSINLITFTDGVDQGSLAFNESFETNVNYRNYLKSRIDKTTVAELPLTAYSLGLRGSDVTDNAMFKANLRALASSDDKAFEVTGMSDVESRLGSIANDIVNRITTTTTTTTQKLSFTIPGTGDGTKVRIVLDGKTAENSSVFIEGTYQTSDKSLHNVTLKGITSGGASSLDVLKGSASGIFVTYMVPDLSDDYIISNSKIRQYNMSTSSSTWQINSEFDPEADVKTETKTETKTTYYGTAVFLLLDCSSSLSSDFSKMKNYANNFIAKIAANAKTESPQRPFGYNDPNKNDPAYKAGLCPDNYHPHVIDLGTAGKWACCNVGASAPWEYGGYYAWGETEKKDYYDLSTYKHCDGSKETFHDLGSDISGTDYDVAYVKWGGKWRMPSKAQLSLNSCTSVWTSVNGVKGKKYTGSNGNSIFLPAAGYRWNDRTVYVGSYGYYWSSTQSPSGSSRAYSLYFGSGVTNWYDNGRGRGLSVRPVTD